MKPKPSIIHLPVYQPGKPIEEVKRELGLDEVIKLASNENPFGCSSRAKDAIISEIENIQIYPDGASQVLTNTLAEFWALDAKQFIFGAGSDEIILMIARAYLSPGDETIMASHTFPQYKHNAEIEGATCIEVPLVDGTHDLSGMLARVTDKTKIIWVCNPNNPTGTIVTADQLEPFLAKVPANVLVVLDEAYAEYVETEQYPNSIEIIDRYRNVITLRTFSKAYGLASLRIGYGIGHPDVIHSINQVREPFNTSRIAQAAANAALMDQSYIEQCKRQNQAGIQYLSAEFDRIGLHYYPAHGNFMMVDCGMNAKEVFDGLLHKGIIVRGGHSLGFPTSIRVTVGSQEQNSSFIRALEEVLQGR